MEASYNLLSLLLGVLAAAAFICACGIVNRRGQPPGPRGLPLIGHLHMLGRLPHHTLAHLSNSYGPLMSLRLGSQPLLVASSPDMAKLILHTHDNVFSGRPQNFSIPKIAFNFLDITFCSPGPYWKFMRQLCFTEFFSMKRLENSRSMREEEVRGLMLSICEVQGRAIKIGEMVQTTNSNLMSRMVLGRRLEELGGASKCMPIVREMFRMMGLCNVSDCMPWLAWMDLQGLGRRSKKVALAASSMFQEVIDSRRTATVDDPPPPARDFLDVLLLASLNSKLHIGDAHMRAVIMDMFAGGTDTSAATIEWALAELLANPEKMAMVEKEIEEVVGYSRLVKESDLPNLPYLQAVVNETLRLHPIGPLLLPRMSMDPCQVSGYHISKNTLVYVNVWAIHRDPKIWNNPTQFSPERFLDSNIGALNQQYKFLPFGAGRRTCPGWKLGLLSTQIILANLVHSFNWKILAKPSMNEKFGLVIVLEDPLVIVPMLKSPSALFETISINPSMNDRETWLHEANI